MNIPYTSLGKLWRFYVFYSTYYIRRIITVLLILVFEERLSLCDEISADGARCFLFEVWD
jgi:hypothetical protein